MTEKEQKVIEIAMERRKKQREFFAHKTDSGKKELHYLNSRLSNATDLLMKERDLLGGES